MTLTLLNLVGIAVAVVLTCVLVVVFVRLRRFADDVEGAIAVIDAPEDDVVDAASLPPLNDQGIRSSLNQLLPEQE